MNENMDKCPIRESALLFVQLVQQGVTLIAILSNSALVYVTVRQKNLRHTCGILLALCALSDVILESITFLPTFLVLLCKQIPLLTCFWAQIHVIFSFNNSYFCLFFIAVDRLLGVACPIYYRFVFTKCSTKFLIVSQSVSFAISLFCTKLSFTAANANANIMIFCEPGESVSGEPFKIVVSLMMAFSLLTIAIYVLIGVFFKFKRGLNEPAQQNQERELTQKLIKSLATIMAILFFSWFCCGLISNYLVPALIIDPYRQILVRRMAAQLLYIAQAINLPVLYLCSSEYRKAIQCEFKLFCRFWQGPRVEQHPAGQFVTSTRIVSTQQRS